MNESINRVMDKNDAFLKKNKKSCNVNTVIANLLRRYILSTVVVIIQWFRINYLILRQQSSK